MTYVIISQGFVNGQPCPHVGQYLESFDPEYFGGTGYATFTPTLSKAMMFETQADAWDCLLTVPKCRPLRPDGKPNRPLRSMTALIEKVG